MVDEDDTKAVDKELVKELDEGLELVDVVVVMVIEVIMKLTVVIEMMLNKEFDVEVDKEVFMVIMYENVSCWKQNWVQFNKKLVKNPVVAM